MCPVSPRRQRGPLLSPQPRPKNPVVEVVVPSSSARRRPPDVSVPGAAGASPWLSRHPELWPRDEVWRQHPSMDATVPPRLPLPLPGRRDVLVLPGADAVALFRGHVAASSSHARTSRCPCSRPPPRGRHIVAATAPPPPLPPLASPPLSNRSGNQSQIDLKTVSNRSRSNSEPILS